MIPTMAPGPLLISFAGGLLRPSCQANVSASSILVHSETPISRMWQHRCPPFRPRGSLISLLLRQLTRTQPRACVYSHMIRITSQFQELVDGHELPDDPEAEELKNLPEPAQIPTWRESRQLKALAAARSNGCVDEYGGGRNYKGGSKVGENSAGDEASVAPSTAEGGCTDRDLGTGFPSRATHKPMEDAVKPKSGQCESELGPWSADTCSSCEGTAALRPLPSVPV